MSRPGRVVIVGGGITGLVAAFRLVAGRRDASPVDVTLVEAAPRVGGKLQTGEVGGLRVETGPDSFVVRKPWAVDLATELGLGPSLIVPEASGAYVWARGRMVRLPEGTAFGVPTDVETILRWPGLSVRGRLAATLDLWRRAPAGLAGDAEDESLTSLLARRLGPEAAGVLTGPVLAGIHAGDPERMSVASTFPELQSWERGAGSLIRGARSAMKASRKPGAARSALFTTVDGGLEHLVEELAARIDPGGVVTNAAVDRIESSAGGGHTVVAGGRRMPADAVIVTTPAAAAAAMLSALAPRADAPLRELRAVSTATVALVYPPGTADLLPHATGLLVPARSDAGDANAISPRAVTACTWMSRKWPDASFGDRAVVRCFVGRDGDQTALELDDDALAAAVAADVELTTPLGERPEATLVTRWPAGMPQYDVGHLARVAAAAEALRTGAPGVFLAGAAYGGIGIADCVRQGDQAAALVRAFLDGASPPPDERDDPRKRRPRGEDTHMDEMNNEGASVAYVYFPVFRALPELRALDGVARDQAFHEVEVLLKEWSDRVTLRGAYSTVGLRPDADLMLWLVAPTIDVVQDLTVALRRTYLGRRLELTHAFTGLVRPAEFTADHAPAFVRGETPRTYLCVYPFVRTPEWYLLPPAQRAGLLREHGEAGREFPDVLANTTSAFGLNDWEWILAFEADDLGRIVDCIRRLREAEARRYTKEEIPFITGIRKGLAEALSDLA